jgi:hypothetical protein
VFRDGFTSLVELSGPKGGHVAGLRVETVRSVTDARGEKPLDVIADPLPDQPGHALIPALNSIAYRDDKKRVTELAMALSKVATLAYMHGHQS